MAEPSSFPHEEWNRFVDWSDALTFLMIVAFGMTVVIPVVGLDYLKSIPLPTRMYIGVGYFVSCGLVSALAVWVAARKQAAHRVFLREKARTSSDPPIVLLRPFYLDSLLKTSTVVVSSGRDYHAEKSSYVLPVASALRDRGVVLALGESDYPESGFAENWVLPLYAAERAWRDALRLSVEAAAAILVFPAATPGCVEELQLIAGKELHGRTIVLMPPEQCAPGRVVMDPTQVSRVWAMLRADLSPHGFALPPYDRNGMLYRPRRDFSIEASAPLAGWWHEPQLREAFEKLLPAARVPPRTTSSLIDALEKLGVTTLPPGSRP